MTTNKKKPSDLAAWAGDKGMVVHAHKAGVSQKVSVQEIINAVPIPVIDNTQIEASVETAQSTADQALLQAGQAQTEVNDLEGRVDTLETAGGGGGGADMSVLGASLVAKETAPEMQGVLDLVKQASFSDSTAGSLMSVGAFGLGATLNSLRRLSNIQATGLNRTGLYEVDSANLASGYILPYQVGRTYYNILHIDGGSFRSSQLLFPQHGSKSMCWFRTSKGYNSWNDWVEVGAVQTPGWDDVGTVVTARVFDATKGTLGSTGFYTEMGGRFGLTVTYFDGSDKPATSPVINGTWNQITHCLHDSPDPLARMALWRRIR